LLGLFGEISTLALDWYRGCLYSLHVVDTPNKQSLQTEHDLGQ